MGLDDRDYMRDRYRKRQGLGGTSWNDRKSRVEHGGAWFEDKNRGHDYQTGRYRARPQFRAHPLQGWIFGLSALLTLVPMYREMKRAGWLPDTSPAVAFPASGSVTVWRDLDPRLLRSRMAVTTAAANAVVQLFDPQTDQHILSVYVQKNDRVELAAPVGTWRMRVAEGQRWHGPRKFFGSSTTYETVAQLMAFPRNGGNGIDLHRRPDGKLPTRINLNDPDPL
jgi:hypothetical protein